MRRGITSISGSSALAIYGQYARASLGAGPTSTALAGLAQNAGIFSLDGNSQSGVGAGGASVTTTTALANSGLVEVDAADGEGGSTLSIGGTLTNIAGFDIGNSTLSGNTTVTATSLANTGVLTIYGDPSATPTFLATLAITGASSPNLTGNVDIEGNADLQLTTGVTSILGGSSLDLYGQYARVSLGAGTANNGLAGLSQNAGRLVLHGNRSNGAGGASVTTTTGFDEQRQLQGGRGKRRRRQHVRNRRQFRQRRYTNIGNADLSANTTVMATGFSSNTYLALQGNNQLASTNQATLAITGSNPTNATGTILVGGNADLQLTNASRRSSKALISSLTERRRACRSVRARRTAR